MASQLSPHPLNTITTIHAGEPSYHTTATGDSDDRHVAYDIAFASIILLFILILFYTCFMCNRWRHPPSPPPPPTSDSEDSDDFHSIILSSTLQDDILSKFPTFVYSDDTAVKPRKLDENKLDENKDTVIHDSRCTICLADYEPSVDVLRVLPECGHLFHVSCIDTWLEVNLICPVCRKSPLPADMMIMGVDLNDQI